MVVRNYHSEKQKQKALPRRTNVAHCSETYRLRVSLLAALSVDLTNLVKSVTSEVHNSMGDSILQIMSNVCSAEEQEQQEKKKKTMLVVGCRG